ncbi:MAG: type III PLP-dependent enzyme [Chloroflexota bacterium]
MLESILESSRPAPPVVTDPIAYLLRETAELPTPLLVLSASQTRENFDRLAAAFPDTAIFYAMKANPHPAILHALQESGCGIDIASGPELRAALGAGFSADRMIFSAPFKRPAAIREAAEAGVGLMVADSPGEVESIARHAPGACLIIRASVPAAQAVAGMRQKFGADLEEVVPLLHQGRRQGLRPWGISFHVGSQCIEAAAWLSAIAHVRPIWAQAAAEGIPLSLLDIGGGFPVPYIHPVPAIEDLASPILRAARQLFAGGSAPRPALAIEPGRIMTNHAAALVTTVLGTAVRGGRRYVYLDSGVFNGLHETLEGIAYGVYREGDLLAGRGASTSLIPVTLAGPTCDGSDVIAHAVPLPPIAIDDRLVFLQTGAYTIATEDFNGMYYPTVFLEDHYRDRAAIRRLEPVCLGAAS